ncbi:MAG: hypothetical protein RBU21_15330 [FCB group bacterium]|jgi:flagellar motility protein MotE (MotC chaperone)|nr:hypothetical protein [FCB group bacterium]
MILYIVILLVGFVGAIVGVLAATHNLNREALDKIMGKVPEGAAHASAEAPDDVDPLLRAIRDQQKKLDEREAAMKAQEERIKTAQADLQKLRDELGALLQQYGQDLDNVDAEAEAQRAEVETLLQKMKPDQAAEIISTKTPEEALALLKLIPEKSRPKVMEKLPPDKAAELIDAMRNAIPATP